MTPEKGWKAVIKANRQNLIAMAGLNIDVKVMAYLLGIDKVLNVEYGIRKYLREIGVKGPVAL